MKVVLISDNGCRHKKLDVNIRLYVVFPIIALLIGYSIVKRIDLFSSPNLSTKVVSPIKDIKAYENFSLIINKLSVLEAEVQRLNTLNSHIASKNKIDINAFDLANVPAQGGGMGTNYFGSSIVRRSDIKKSIDELENNLETQKLKLKNLLTAQEIKEAEEYLASLPTRIVPSKREEAAKRYGKDIKEIAYDFSTPLKKGYISSPFGRRRDPINGSLRHHSGLDIAAKKGSNVYAIANGFVSFSGKKGAYGNLLEINHSETLKSRYAHLARFLVKKGQLVRKGELIGKVGTTGRVTGPHLHLEIREYNKIKNPKYYLSDALKDL